MHRMTGALIDAQNPESLVMIGPGGTSTVFVLVDVTEQHIEQYRNALRIRRALHNPFPEGSLEEANERLLLGLHRRTDSPPKSAQPPSPQPDPRTAPAPIAGDDGTGRDG
jgi:hypothetical protein